ncbi:Hypothetical predicted protein [Mytilus galloprovincialis]|uniref:Uncharacterized protein n=1 Tax=Mytilus galloprovincialis TaxID=29158 RepID=A0A8B6C0A6_MYTGA|nr:Hypothetical predicted protein [Mytilus galloprovincialis]
MVQWMLRNDVVVDQCTDDGECGIFQASETGRTDIVKLLLDKNANVNLYNTNNISPLLMASQNGHTDIVKLLLERNPDINLCHINGSSPLLQASHYGHTDIVNLLLERNPDVNLCNKDGCSPMLQAIQNGHTDIVKLLLERNPDVNLCDNYENSPLIQASYNGHTDIVILLLERNPDPCDNTSVSTSYVYNNISISNSPSLVQSLMKHKPDINAQTYDGGSALYFSALNGNIEITQLLLKNYADCNICINSIQYITDALTNHPSITLDEEKQVLFDSLVKSTSCVTYYVSNKSVDYAFDVVTGTSPLHNTHCLFYGKGGYSLLSSGPQ